ncbi:hypothetical protein SCUCBS95973_009955 [Sporothrix curviconia]|uniref:Ankyrin repeat protein n=1 Tax=Sporothrix curviconia TaxID=1260050 RepID=A0ABP0D2T1_9PEZI
MLRWIKTHLDTATPLSRLPPKTYRHTPGLYPAGNTTVETYFRRLLEGPLPVFGNDLVRRDIVAAAVAVARQAGVAPPADRLLPLLTRCITGTYEAVAFADAYFVEEGGPSALATPLVLQVLVAVALKHRHADLVRELLAHNGRQHRPETTLFEGGDPSVFGESPHGILSDPSYGPRVWGMLADAGWAPSLSVRDDNSSDSALLSPIDSEEARPLLVQAAAQSRTDPAGALAVLDELVRRGLDPVPYTGYLFDVLVKEGTAEMVAHFLPLVSRAVYDGVPPRARWPGMPSVVTMAAARSDKQSECRGEQSERSERSEENLERSEDKSEDKGEKTLERSEDESEDRSGETLEPEGTTVLRVLVDVAGMDVHVDPGVWYKAGPDDEHPMAWQRSTRLADGSYADDAPLLTAVQAGNAASVRFLLQRGVHEKREGVLAEAVARARARQDGAMVRLLEGWTVAAVKTARPGEASDEAVDDDGDAQN